jgi:tetratricopeptide (TPR) repeat protein
LYAQLAEDFPSVAGYQNAVAGTLGNLAMVLRDRGDLAGARRLLNQAMPRSQVALKSDPRDPSYRDFFRKNETMLGDILLRLGKHSEAAGAASRLVALVDTSPNDNYNAACLLARCVQLAREDAKLPTDQRVKLAQSYADRAMAALQKAVAAGYRDAKHMQEDHDLDSLRGRGDFKQLLATLQKAGPPKPAKTGAAPSG